MCIITEDFVYKTVGIELLEDLHKLADWVKPGLAARVMPCEVTQRVQAHAVLVPSSK